MPASVICGVTFSVSAASLNVTAIVLFALRLDGDLNALLDLGRLVVLRRHLRRREDPRSPLPLEGRDRRVEAEASEHVPHGDPERRVEARSRQVHGVPRVRREPIPAAVA